MGAANDDAVTKSERTVVAEDLRHSEEIFRLLVESVREYAIFILDPTGHVATWNGGAERLKGYTADEIVGQHFSRFYPPEVPRDVIDHELEIAESEGQFHDEGWRIRKDGSRFWADVTITPVHEHGGGLRGFAKVTRDMTARKRAEEQRADLIREQAARAEAERANRMKDDFMATLSHELRTPLNSIVGWVELLESGTLDAEKTRKAVAVIRRNAMAQTQLVSDILDISRISSGTVHLRMEPVDLGKVIQAAVDTVGPAATAKGISIVPSIDGGAGPVSGDAGRLQQVVWNLLSNSVKFSPPDGRVDVRLKGHRSHVEITVADTGPGIAPDFVPLLFQPFRMADASATRRQGGLGLGLAIVRHLVELHRGSVRLERSEPGRGAVFTVQLPVLAHTQPEGGRASSETRSPSLHGLEVLVVEDDEDSRFLLHAMLEQAGATVRSAVSAAQGLALLQERRPDVLVSDIGMADRSGYDLVAQVRELSVAEGGLVPAIALTAYARPEDRMRALSSGFQIHLAKPVQSVELVAAVAALTARTRPSPE
jgi:PAS domain S-box-containing protein